MPESTPTIASVLTPPGRGAVAVVAVAGLQARNLVERFFQPKAQRPLAERRSNEIVYGRWGNDSTNAPQEDVIVCCRSENSVEVHCHGGDAAVRRIVDDLISVGATRQNWTDWIGGRKSNSIRAAARCALAQATTLRAAAILLDQYHGALEKSLRDIVNSLAPPHPGPLPGGEGEDRRAAILLKQLLDRAAVGLHLIKPWRVVVAGPPNVGKSSLINALLGYQRSIVFDQPGTTRDVVTASAALDGWPVAFSDTAGWRDSGEPLEAAGVEKAQQQAAAADCLLLVFDSSQAWSDQNQQIVANWPGALVVGNKCDLPHAGSGPYDLLISALTGEGIETLIQAIVNRLVPIKLAPGDAVPFTDEQVTTMEAAQDQLQNGNSAAAKESLLALLA